MQLNPRKQKVLSQSFRFQWKWFGTRTLAPRLFPQCNLFEYTFLKHTFSGKAFTQVYFGLNLGSFRTAFIQIITNREESIRESYFRVKGLDQKLECGEATDTVADCSLKKLNNANLKFLFYS